MIIVQYRMKIKHAPVNKIIIEKIFNINHRKQLYIYDNYSLIELHTRSASWNFVRPALKVTARSLCGSSEAVPGVAGIVGRIWLQGRVVRDVAICRGTWDSTVF